MTFFTTGILARNCPQLIRKIYEDGHEIGCHYNFHDNINQSNREDFARNLDIAIDSIENITGEKPLGFRAPSFAIDRHNTWAYEELAKRFAYDSSYKTSSPIVGKLNAKKFQFKENNLYEFCIFELPLFGRFHLKSGGTFFRLFPSGLTLKVMKKTYEFGHVPLIYMHPYELTLNGNFWVPWKDLSGLPFFSRLIKWARQTQWSHLGHKGVEKKMETICTIFEHQGPMRMLLKDHEI